MRKTLLRSAPAAALLLVEGCAAPTTAQSGRLDAFYDTRLQYAILTEDQAALRKEFQMNPERSGLERGLTAVTLPFAAATETLFWPAFYGMTYEVSRKP